MLNSLKNNPERAIEMMKTFKRDGISHKPGKSLNLVIEWQDIVGRSTMSDIEAFFMGLSEGRYKDTFHFINMNCLDQATAIEILKMTTLADEIAKAHKRTKESREAKEEMLQDQIKYLQDEVDGLKAQKKADDRSMKIMSEDIEHLRASGAYMNKKADELELKAAKANDKLDTIKKAFEILNSK